MKDVYGDLITMALDGEFDIIIQGCNCFNVFGHGLAKDIKEDSQMVIYPILKLKKEILINLGIILLVLLIPKKKLIL